MTIEEVEMLEHLDSNHFVPYANFGAPTATCNHCKAFFWLEEATSTGEYSKCCQKGTVVLPPFPEPPLYLKSMLWCQERPEDDILRSDIELFKQKVRLFNSQLSCASISMDKDRYISNAPGIRTLRIHGSVYHNIGSILFNPELYPNDWKPSFMQILFNESGFQANQYDLNNAGLQLFNTLYNIVNNNNVLYNTFKAHVNEQRPILETNHPIFTIRFKTDIDRVVAHPRTVNAPTIAANSWEVAAIVIPPTDNAETRVQTHRDLIVFSKDSGHPQRIKYTHAAYDPLAYSLTHCYGSPGWHLQIPKHKWQLNDAGIVTYSPTTSKFVTAMEYYSYRAHFREPKIIPADIMDYNNNYLALPGLTGRNRPT
jgi:hypothetical protein